MAEPAATGSGPAGPPGTAGDSPASGRSGRSGRTGPVAEPGASGSPASTPRQLAGAILAGVGGPKNVRSVEHCTTRLRFVLYEPKLADRDAVSSLPGVLSVVERGGQFQVVIGHQVPTLYAEIAGRPDLGTGAVGGARRSLLDRLFDLLAGTFQPLLFVMVGGAMVKTALSLVVQFGWLSRDSATYALWAAAGNAAFYFLPVLVGFTAGRKLGANPYLGAVIGAALLEPNYTTLAEAGVRTTFLGIPLVLTDYAQSVFPTIIAVALLSVMERWLKGHVRKDLQLAVVPGLCLAVLVPATFLVFGPIGQVVGEAIADGIAAMNQASPMLTGAVFAATFMFLVMFGLHWALVPVMLSGIAENGLDPLVAYMGAYNWAVFGLGLAVFLRTRDPALRQVSGSGVAGGLLAGVSEPIVYGIILRFKRTVAIMMVAAAAGGAIMGATGTQGTVIVFSSAFSIPSFTPTLGYALGIVVAFLLGFVLTATLGYESRWTHEQPAPPESPPGASVAADASPLTAAAAGAPDQVVGSTGPGPGQLGSRVSAAAGAASTASDSAGKVPGISPAAGPDSTGLPDVNTTCLVRAPIPGQVVPLAAVSDPVFAGGMLGPGAAIVPIVPDAGAGPCTVVAPVAGRVNSVSRTGHALGISTAAGVDVLVHVGTDTVALGGAHFEALVRPGEHVAAGDPVIRFDAAAVAGAGYDLTTPVVVANAAALGDVAVTTRSAVAAGDALLHVLTTR